MKTLALSLLAIVAFSSENNSLEVKTLAGNTDAVYFGFEENSGFDSSRTFALTTSYEWGKSRVLLNYDMLTSFENTTIKGQTPSSISYRTDRFDLLYTYRIGEPTNYIRVGGGIRHYGQAGGAECQIKFHALIGNSDEEFISDSDYRIYEDTHALLGVAQASYGGILGDKFGVFLNANADISTKNEVNINGFAGFHAFKTAFVGLYHQGEYDSYSKTVEHYNSLPRSHENGPGIRFGLTYKNLFADFSLAFSSEAMDHFRIGFTF